MCSQIDLVMDVVLFGMHIFPTLQHVLALHQTIAESHQFLAERCRGFVNEAGD